VEHQYRTIPSQSPHVDTTPVVQNVRSLANRQNEQKRGPSGKSQLLPAQRLVSVQAGERDSSQGGSSVASKIQGQNSLPSSSLNNSHVADNSQWVTSTRSATQRRSIYTPIATPVTRSCSTPAARGTSICRVVSSPAFAIAITPNPHSGLENLPTPCLIQKPTQWLQIHSEHELPKRISDRGSGNYNHRRCQLLDQWSPALAESIDLVSLTWRVLCLQWADSWNSTCGTDGRLCVQVTWRQ